MKAVKKGKKNTKKPSDRILISRVKDGNKLAFKQLHSRYHQAILKYLYRLIKDYQIAEDLAQETFILVYKNIDKYKPVGKVSSWIYRIAQNLARNTMRRGTNKNLVLLSTPITSKSEQMELSELISDTSPSVFKRISAREFRVAVRRAIDKILPKYRNAFLMCKIQGLSYEETARVLNCSSTNVGARLNRARKMIQQMVKPDEYL